MRPTGMLATGEVLVFSSPRMFTILEHFGLAMIVTASYYSVGVGELSAINGIAGCALNVKFTRFQVLNHHFTAFAEELPVLQIVGQQKTKDQEEGLTVIHTLGDGRYAFLSHPHRQ